MFARKVSVLLKSDSVARFSDLVTREILPWLRKQEGFLDLIVLAATDSREVATISFWDHQGNAEAYNSSAYPQVLQVLEELLEGQPYVKMFDVISSTLRVALVPLPEADTVVHETDSAWSGCHSYETH